MSRLDISRIEDIDRALTMIRQHLKRGTLEDDLVFDAVRIRFVEIGEAVKLIDPRLLATEPDIPWSQVAKFRDKLTHHYLDASQQILAETIAADMPKLEAATKRLALQVAMEQTEL